LVALAGLILLALFTLGLVDPGVEPDPVAISRETAIEVLLDPARAFAGVGAAILLLAAALWVIKRTDWSLDGA
jgi:hypothetical protein